jgi:hypothetical protein
VYLGVAWLRHLIMMPLFSAPAPMQAAPLTCCSLWQAAHREWHGRAEKPARRATLVGARLELVPIKVDVRVGKPHLGEHVAQRGRHEPAAVASRGLQLAPYPLHAVAAPAQQESATCSNHWWRQQHPSGTPIPAGCAAVDVQRAARWHAAAHTRAAASLQSLAAAP